MKSSQEILDEIEHFYANRKNFQKLEVPNWPQINFYGNQFMYVSPDDGQRARDALGL